MDFTNIIISIIGAGGITALITSWFNKQKTRAEVEQILQNTYSKIISDLKDQIQSNNEYYAARMLALEEDCHQLRQTLIKSEEKNYKCLMMIDGLRSKNETVRNNRQNEKKMTGCTPTIKTELKSLKNMLL